MPSTSTSASSENRFTGWPVAASTASPQLSDSTDGTRLISPLRQPRRTIAPQAITASAANRSPVSSVR